MTKFQPKPPKPKPPKRPKKDYLRAYRIFVQRMLDAGIA